MAADTMAADDVGAKCNVTKISRIDGALVGTAGDFPRCSEFIAWLRAGKPGDDLPKMKNVVALVLDKSGIHAYDGSCTPYKIIDPFAAVGSGDMAALAAMHMGASPKEAVRVAAKVDSHTGGRVQSLKLR